MLGNDVLHDIPKHVLITSAAVTKSGIVRTTHFALICNSSIPIIMGGHVFRFCQSAGEEWATCRRERSRSQNALGPVSQPSW